MGIVLFFFAAAAAAHLFPRLRNADVHISRPASASAVAAAVMLFFFLHIGGDKASYFNAYALFIAGVALVFVHIWSATDRQRPARAVAALAIVIALLIAKLAVAALFWWLPSEEAKADGRVNLDDVSMLSAAGIVLNMLAQIV